MGEARRQGVPFKTKSTKLFNTYHDWIVANRKSVEYCLCSGCTSKRAQVKKKLGKELYLQLVKTYGYSYILSLAHDHISSTLNASVKPAIVGLGGT